MKKILIISVIIMAMVSLVGCGGNSLQEGIEQTIINSREQQ